MTDKRENKKRIKTTDSKAKKTGRIMLRALILVVVFCVLIFGGIVISDWLFSDDGDSPTPEIIAVTVSGRDVILNDNRQVTLVELRTYLADAQEKGELFTVALINDTENPADYEVYNRIVDLLSEFDIVCEKMKAPSSFDEYAASYDEKPTVG